MDSYLLDTHTILWYLEANPLLSKKAKETIEDAENETYISHVSLWEIAIKMSIRKLTLDTLFIDFEKKLIQEGFSILPIASAHITEYSKLPLHHRDPFDRLFIAQAIANGYKILGQDSSFDSYPVEMVWK